MQSPVYVIYPAPLFDGWEVVRDGAGGEPEFFDSRDEAVDHAQRAAARAGGGRVVVENWFGERQDEWEVLPPDNALPSVVDDPALPRSHFL